MTERPILMSGAMVRAILDGRKTQTRRVVTKPDHYGCLTGDCSHQLQVECDRAMVDRSPYGQPGDRLWVRETFQRLVGPHAKAPHIYRADGDEVSTWRPAIHMPRAACRLVLEVTAVRVERLQKIGEEDARAEGVDPAVAGLDAHGPLRTYRTGYVRLWNALNEKRGYGWLNDPWVWVVSFRKL